MKKLLLLMVALTALAALSACAKAGRYSPSEIKDYPSWVQDRVKNNEISLGMTQLQVRHSWGTPVLIRVLDPEGDKYREEWIYRTMVFFKTRLVFTDGVLTDIISKEISLKSRKYKITDPPEKKPR